MVNEADSDSDIAITPTTIAPIIVYIIIALFFNLAINYIIHPFIFNATYETCKFFSWKWTKGWLTPLPRPLFLLILLLLLLLLLHHLLSRLDFYSSIAKTQFLISHSTILSPETGLYQNYKALKGPLRV